MVFSRKGIILKLLWQQIPSIYITDILSDFNGSDGVVIDCEHGNFSGLDIYSSIQLINSKNKKSFVRICDIYSDKTLIRQCLDSNVSGLIFANIQNDYQVAEIIKHTYYYPIGTRGQGLVRENTWGAKPLGVNNKTIIIQIESATAVTNLETILKYDNLISYYMIGMYDLSASLGVAGDFQNHNFLSCINKIEQVIGSQKLGIHLVNNQDIKNDRYKSYNFICYGMDTKFILQSLADLGDYLTKATPKS